MRNARAITVRPKPGSTTAASRETSGRAARSAQPPMGPGAAGPAPRFLGLVARRRAPATPAAWPGAVPVGPVHSAQEAQADSLAERAAERMPEPLPERAAAQAGAASSGPGQPLTPPPAGASPRAPLPGASGCGRGLSASTQAALAPKVSFNLSQVRVHADDEAARANRLLGSDAFTYGDHIYFGRGRSDADLRLTAHELTHVGQQRDSGQALIQRSITAATPAATSLGVFSINMVNAGPSLSGTISFMPDANGPYSAEIGLIQAINITDVPGRSSGTAGSPVDWRNVIDANTPGVVGAEGGRMDLMTTGTDGAPAGWYIDSFTRANPRGSPADGTATVGPNYQEHFGNPSRQMGWLRSPTDRGPATLFDAPGFSFDTNFDFETVAKGTDNQVVYGGLFWGFRIRSGAVQAGSEYARAADGTSATFDEALERFRGFYVHEPIVLYFDTDQDIPRAGEEGKLADVVDYLDRYPDVMVRIDGYADIRGSEEYNFGLSDRRALAAENLLLLQGVAADRVEYAMGAGETQEFSQHGTAPGARQPITAGRLQANRRVVISFTHTASNVPINLP